MDVTEFRLIRPTRSVDDAAELRLGELELPPPKPTPETEEAPEAESHVTTTALARRVGSLKTDPLADPGDAADANVVERIYGVVGALDRALAAVGDRLSGETLEETVAKLLDAWHLDEVDWADLLRSDQAGPETGFRIAAHGIREALVAVLTRRSPDYAEAQALTRRALVAALLAERYGRLGELTPLDVHRLVNGRSVVLDGITAKELVPHAQVRLVRKAEVADLHVVRREWAGYLASEIANIRNVMAGETFNQLDKTVRETETTTTDETESRTSSEREDSSKTESELSEEINTELGITVNGYAEASAEFKYPVVTAHVGGGVNVGLALQRSERHASKIAREAVTRAVSRVDSTTRESRVRRELMRTELQQTYELANKDGGNVHAVYRWVDRVDTYQVFRYPDRFLLEIEVPEPAEFYRWRTGRLAARAAAVDKPPEWNLQKSEITPDGLVDLARRFRATSLPSAPDPTVSVVRTLHLETSAEGIPKGGSGTTWNATPTAGDIEIPIPTDYVARKVRYQGEAYPLLGEWGNANKGNPTGYRTAMATVTVGDNSKLYWNGGIQDKGTSKMKFLATHQAVDDPGVVDEVQRETPPYGRALLPIGGGTGIDADTDVVTIDPPATATVKAGVSAVGVLSCAVTFLVECTLSDTAYAAWQLGVYDALFAAWSDWKRDYEAAGVRQALVGSSAADAGGSQRNEQVIREELKREAIGWLLDDEGFAGRPGLKARPTANGAETDFADIDFDRARADAPTIQFLEQAFEWNNLSYMFYPYYWAARDDWEELAQITANDPEFERFLRSGSARVIIPTRPGFEDAVQNWLKFRVPFITGQLPAPDDPLYVSIDREIRELTSPWEGGIPGDTWQSRVSTTLLYLEEEGDLPFTNDQHQLPATPGKTYVPAPYITFP